ncbi:MAG: hypothetical protein OXT65_01455, partial [Alphaproteobacteria bacterium]|nr:hypothetical protein [Alphaproteobacteria bacterium]
EIIHMRPYNNAHLEFDITVPKTWTCKDLTIDKKSQFEESVIGDVVRCEGEMISIYRPHVTVSVRILDHELEARHWLHDHLLNNGFTPLEEIIAESPKKAAVTYSTVIQNESIHSYIVVKFTGRHAIVTRFDTPLPIQDYISYIQKKIPDSLKLTYPQDDTIEFQKNFTLLDALKFEYPISWSVQAPDYKNMSRFSVSLQNMKKSGVIGGYIDLLALRKGGEYTLKSGISDLKKHFDQNIALNFDELVSSTEPENINRRFKFKRYEVYNVSYKKDGFINPEIHYFILSDSEWYVHGYLITPRKSNNLLEWARNTRTFNMIMESIR